MIGQTELVGKVNTYSYERFPHSLIIVGSKGSGRHTLVNLISDRYRVPVIDILTMENIDEAYLYNEPYIYVLDVTEASKNKKIIGLQNSLLKFIEEPPANCKIIIITESKNHLLDTVLNRCHVWNMRQYTPTELREFNKELPDHYLKMLGTPGAVGSVDTNIVQTLSNLCDNIIENMTRANISNALTIANKIDLKDDYLLLIFMKLFRDKISKTDNFEAFMWTKKFMEDMSIMNINIRSLFEKYLLELKEVL